jgi:lipoprotein-releasing system permease protein
MNPVGWYQRLLADPRVKAYSPQLTANVILTRAKTAISGRLIGSRPEMQVKVTNIEEFMLKGRFIDLQVGGNRVVAGAGLMDKLGAHMGETMLISTGMGGAAPFKVIGIFKTGIKQIDDSTAFAELADVQRVNRTPEQVTDIAVRLHDFNQAKELALAMSKASVEKVQSWDQINENFLNVFRIQDATRYMMITVILIVAGFGIYNILNMTVNQKKKEIAILRSMGFEGGDIVELFLLQGAILGFMGGVIGLGVGYFICLQLQKIKFGGGPMGGAGYLKIAFLPDIYFFGFLLPLVVSILASVLPARAAARMTPIQIIREGSE